MTINIDQDLENADWVKKTWDVLGVNTDEELKEFLKEQGMTLKDFKKLPSYQGWLNRNLPPPVKP